MSIEAAIETLEQLAEEFAGTTSRPRARVAIAVVIAELRAEVRGHTEALAALRKIRSYLGAGNVALYGIERATADCYEVADAAITGRAHPSTSKGAP